MPLPLVHELDPPPDVFGALAALSTWSNVVLLESALLRDGVGRYSYLTAEPYRTVELAAPQYGESPFEELRGHLTGAACERIPGLPPFQGGAIGLLAYELGQCWEHLPRAAHDEFSLPVMVAGVYDWVLAWDHVERRAWIIAHGGGGATASGAAALRADRRIEAVLDALRTFEPRMLRPAPRSQVGLHAPVHPVPGAEGVLSNFSRDDYLTAVERVIEFIRAGDIFQANLSQRLIAPALCSPLELYGRLRRRNPAPFAAYFAHDDWAVLSASPERFLRLENGRVETRPIKGTRRRRPGPEADLLTRDELRESEKDRAENVMIVDLLRNDLSKVCRPGSIRVSQLCEVETYETVQHLVSEVCGDLCEGRDFWDLLAATFPGGSITGAPKIRAMEIITGLEQVVRGPYCGSLVWCGFDGAADSSILIRTFIQKGGWVHCPAGGGIVVLSDPVAEYEETLHKAEGMLRALL
ncbi:MAG: anthranilate synthase component I family protein [Planctomycetaceae bacterium]|nr:anthranilate synthase component I family protein [Planctomycetaceae bacterium]